MDMNLLYKKVLENPLILEIIFKQLCREDLFQLCKVCQVWKDTATIVIRRTVQLFIHLDKENWRDKMISDFDYFVYYNLHRICFIWSNEITKNLATAFHLKGAGNLVKDLSIEQLNLHNEADFIALEAIINSMPNLEKLDIVLSATQINSPLFRKFNPNFRIKFVEIDAIQLNVKNEDAETIVTEILRIFGNLTANFKNPKLDRYLFTFLSKRKEPLASLHKIQLFTDLQLCTLKTMNSSIPNLKKLRVNTGIKISKSFVTSFESCLKQFANSLEIVNFQFSADTEESFPNAVITVPSLPKLRSLTLGIPLIIDGKPAVLWDLGKQLSKDFPVLEELSVKKDWTRNLHGELSLENYKYPETWCIWEAVVPIDGKQLVDLSPFKTMKEVIFNLPKAWLSDVDNIPWAKSFLEVCYKLYPGSNLYYNKEIEMLETLTGMPKSFTRL